MNRLWMVCYDISDDRARRAVAESLLGVGERIQESVFECTMGMDGLRALLDRLAELIDPGSDSLRAYPLCAWCEGRVAWLGLGRRSDDPDLWIV